MNVFNQIIRGVLFLILAVLGALMATIIMVSTAIAAGILYIVARITGRPFGARAYWESRRSSAANKPLFKNKDITDIEMREVP